MSDTLSADASSSAAAVFSTSPLDIRAIRWRQILWALLVWLLAACTTEYKPDVWVKGDIETVPLRAEFHPLQLGSALQRGKEPFGVVAEHTANPSVKEMQSRIETLLFEELRLAHVFTDLSYFDPNPDLVVTGRLDAFHERYRQHLWTYLPYADKAAEYLDLKTHESQGEVALTLILLTPSGETIGRYPAQITFADSFSPSDEMPPGSRLNEAFAKALRQILDAWAEDPALHR